MVAHVDHLFLLMATPGTLEDRKKHSIKFLWIVSIFCVFVNEKRSALPILVDSVYFLWASPVNNDR